MPALKVAHLREQGQDMILVPLDRSFGYPPYAEQTTIIAEYQRRANGAGLRGTVVAYWESGFVGPTRWHAYLQSISLSFAHANVNKQISW